MFGVFGGGTKSDLILDAFGRSQAIIEFKLDGTIVDANENFLKILGYKLEEIKGKHHSIFVESAYASSSDYSDFWRRLASGQYQAGEFMRLAKNGDQIWILASYNPILDKSGKATGIVKIASDISAAMRKMADHQGQIDAINKSQAVIHFDLEGRVLDANENLSLRSATGWRRSKASITRCL